MLDALRAPAPPDRAALAATRRHLVARLLVPRGREQLWKWVLIPVGAALAAAVHGTPPSLRDVAAVVLVWLVAEQLGYQARYQLNDLRDRAADAAHPAGLARGRLSFPWTPLRAALVWGSVAARAATAVGVTALVLDGTPQEAAAWFLVVMVLTSAAYEAVRERVRREVVAPGTARARALGVPVMAVVPLGYGLRVWAGYHTLRPEGAELAPVVLVVAAVLCLYTASTLLAWALEGTSFLRARPGGGVDVEPSLGARAHIAVLVEHAGLLHRGDPAPDDRTGAGGVPVPSRLVLARDRPVREGAPLLVWDVAAAAAVALAHAVVAVGSGVGGAAAVALVLTGAVSTAAPLIARRLRRPGLTRGGPWDERPSWLGAGALAATVAVEVGALVVLVVVLAVTAPGGLWLVWFVAFVLFHWGATRASSYERGFGPLSLVRRPLRWAKARRAGAVSR